MPGLDAAEIQGDRAEQPGNGGAIVVGGDVPASYPATAIALLRLGGAADGLPDGALDAECDFLAALLAVEYPCIGDPSALSGPDLTFFSRAVGLLAAARLYPALAPGSGGIAIRTTTADGSTEQFAAPDTDKLSQAWAKEGMEAMSYIACVRAGIRIIAAGTSLFGLAGRRRQQQGNGQYTSLVAYGLQFLNLDMFPLAAPGDYGAGIEIVPSFTDGS